MRGASRAAPTFALLDEPTNHLDLDTIEWLEGRLRAASFGFILVTHDRYFLDGVCTAIMEIADRSILKYPGNYSSLPGAQGGAGGEPPARGATPRSPSFGASWNG